MRSNLKYCRYCNAAIVWAKHADTRKPIPLEPVSVPGLDRFKTELTYSPEAGHVAHRCKGKGAA
mgnify:CR=1 FL=1